MGSDADLPTLPASGSSPGDGGTGAATYGRFISLGVIGRGGMGLVLRARDPELDRDVAIKLLAPLQWGESDPTSAQRLQREAQAMAKLSHPNVVTVYEMGQVGNARFIAMELVEGTTLRRWLAAGGRSWREIVAAFVACGRGLAAAHAAGLVHRDFKPENVLMGADQRPRVTDFGLVATGVTIDSGDLGGVSPVSELTVRGAVIGTPMYMAPEQWGGQEVDARTDQFAFCVALWEAVYGERPFAGTSGNEVRESVLAGELRPPPRNHKVGRGIERLLRRGLARDRAARWPSMTALLAELDRPRRRRWPWAVAALGIAGAAVAVAIVAQPAASDPCPDPRARLGGVWDSAMKDRIVAAFAAVNPAIAAEVSQRVVPALDDYGTRWRTATVAACRATKVEGTQSPQLLDARMVCLDRRRADLGALTGALATADRDRVATAINAVGSLGDIDQCANRETLLAFPLPTDPKLRRRVDALEAEVAASYASRFAGKPAERQARAGAALATARALGYLPTLVRALNEHYNAARDNRDNKVAEASVRELAQKAAEAHDDSLAALAWIKAIQSLAQRGQLDEAKTLEPVAEAAVTRAGATPALRYGLLVAIAVRQIYAQEFDAGIASLHTAVDIAETDLKRAAAQQLLAQATMMRDGPAGALPVAEQSLTATEAAFGSTHPDTADRLHLLAQILSATGELDRAHAAETRALAIREAALGADHVEVAASLHTLGNIARTRGKHTTARKAYERAVAIMDAKQDVDGAALTRGLLATVVRDDEGIAAARPIFLEALRGLEATIGRDHVNYVQTEANFATTLIEAGACDEAEPLLAHASTVLEKVSPRQIPVLLEASARCDLAAGRVAQAIAKLERGRAVCAAAECPIPIAETLAWRLGKILVESRRDRVGGMKLVEEAVTLAIEHQVNGLRIEIETWRKTHR